jgi:hypothetical protein
MNNRLSLRAVGIGKIFWNIFKPQPKGTVRQSRENPERGVPLIRQLADRISIRNINETVDLKLGGDPRFARKVKYF